MMKNILAIGIGLITCVAVAEDLPRRQITVTGNCRRQTNPDRASLQLTAEARDPDLPKAYAKAGEIYEKLRTSLGKMNLENFELKTTESNVQELREWEKDKMVSKGFQARMGLRVSTSQIAKMGEVLALAAKSGVREIGQLQSYLSDNARDKARLDCLEEAARDAKKKADRLASALKSEISRLISLEEEASPGSQAPVPMFRASMTMAKGQMAEAPTIEGGQLDLELQVRASFEVR